MAVAVQKPPVDDAVVVNPSVPSWAGLSRSTFGGSPSIDREYVPELRWPASIPTFERMSTDTQLSGLYRGTALPIRRYVWGIDPNGADPKIVDAALRDFNLMPIDDAWKTFQTGQSNPVPRARNEFALDQHWQEALAALKFAHAHFFPFGEIGDDQLWHPIKITLIPQWTISQFSVARNGSLEFIRQQGLFEQPLDGRSVISYVNERQSNGDWIGKSGYRSCYREWLLKDRLLRVDLRNHEKGGGVLLPIAPENATPQTREQLAQLSQAYAAGGGGSLPAGTNPVFIRSSGSDVIASIDRHDAAMAREFLMMFMSLGTNNQSGNRALGAAFIDWFAIAQEATAVWLRDVFNKNVLERYVDWNFGDQDYVPRLEFRRPEQENPVADIANMVNKQPGDAATAAFRLPDGSLLTEIVDGVELPVIASGRTRPGAVVVDDETRFYVTEAFDEYERWARPAPRRARAAAAAPSVPVPAGRKLRRDPFAHEVTAAVDFKQTDANWQSGVARLVADWQEIRQRQVHQLTSQILTADGDLTQLAQISAEAAGGDLIAARLAEMASKGVAEATAEAHRQDVTVRPPDLAKLEADLTARAGALEQLLSNALSQAAANKAVQLTGGTLAPADVAAQVKTYIAGLSDTYLTDQFGGAMSAAQNGGRLAVMDENQPSRMYASELLDANTCDACAEEDGTEFLSAEEAAAAYPAGGFKDCEGGPRCRGIIVAVYAEASSNG